MFVFVFLKKEVKQTTKFFVFFSWFNHEAAGGSVRVPPLSAGSWSPVHHQQHPRSPGVSLVTSLSSWPASTEVSLRVKPMMLIGLWGGPQTWRRGRGGLAEGVFHPGVTSFLPLAVEILKACTENKIHLSLEGKTKWIPGKRNLLKVN